MRHRLLICATMVVAAVGASTPAFAQLTRAQQGQVAQPGQTRAQRPTRALFGGTRGDTSQELVLTGAVNGGYDQDLTSKGTPGQFNSGSANLAYTVDTPNYNAGFSAGANGRYYPGIGNQLVNTYSFSGQIGFKVSANTTVAVSSSAGVYLQNAAIFYSGGLSAGSTPTSPANAPTLNDTRTYSGVRSDVQLSHKLTNRISFSAGYAYYVNDAWSASSGGRYSAQNGNASASFAIIKGLAIHAGYGIHESGLRQPGSPAPFRGSTIDAGIDFNRALSLTRRSSLTFSTGMVGIRDQALNTRYFFTGAVNLAYEIGRSWSISTGYNRAAEFFQVLGQPVLSDALGLNLGGVIGRRLQLNGGGGYIKGKVGVAADAPNYTAANAGANLNIALTRQLALGVGYAFFRYEFDQNAVLPPGMSPRMDRQSVNVSINVWVPIMMRARRN